MTVSLQSGLNEPRYFQRVYQDQEPISMQFIRMSCPKCKSRGRIDDRFIGRAVRCRKCGARFTVQASAPFSATTVRPLKAELPTPLTGPSVLAQRIKCRRCGKVLDAETTTLIQKVELVGIKSDLFTCSCGGRVGIKDIADVSPDVVADAVAAQRAAWFRRNPTGAAGKRTHCPLCRGRLGQAQRQLFETVERLGVSVSAMPCEHCGRRFGTVDYPPIKVAAPSKFSVWVRSLAAAEVSAEACKAWLITQRTRGIEVELSGEIPADTDPEQLLFETDPVEFLEAVRTGVQAQGGDPDEVFVDNDVANDVALFPVGYLPKAVTAAARKAHDVSSTLRRSKSTPHTTAAPKRPSAQKASGRTKAGFFATLAAKVQSALSGVGDLQTCPCCRSALPPEHIQLIRASLQATINISLADLQCPKCGGIYHFNNGKLGIGRLG